MVHSNRGLSFSCMQRGRQRKAPEWQAGAKGGGEGVGDEVDVIQALGQAEDGHYHLTGHV